MILIVGEEKFEISPKTILNGEAISVKKKIGMGFQAWMDAMTIMDPEALTAFVWVAKKRMEPTLKYEDVSFALASVNFELDDDEKAEAEKATLPKAEADEAESNESKTT